MSECDGAAATGCEEAEAACPCSGGFYRVLPYLLLAAAAGLWIWNNQKMKEVRTVVEKLATPIRAVMIGQKVEGHETTAVVVCPPTEATKLLECIAQAKPARFPRKAEGTECEIHLIHTEGPETVLKAVCLEDDPETLYVGVKYPGKRDEHGTVLSWTVSPPVQVPKGGVLVNDILNLIHKVTPAIIEKLPSTPPDH